MGQDEINIGNLRNMSFFKKYLGMCPILKNNFIYIYISVFYMIEKKKDY